MTNRNAADSITLRLPAADSATGIGRETLERLAQRLGVDETQAIHLAMREMAGRMLPHFKTVQAPGASAHTHERRGTGVRQRMVRSGCERRAVNTVFYLTGGENE
jgi:hypothetical protein